jgi:two-component sensor histidine kinase
MALRSKGKLEAAKAELNPAIDILTRLGDPYSVSVYTAELAQINLAASNTSEAEEQLLEAYELARGEGLKEQIRDFSQMLVDFYESQGAFEQALDYQKVYQVYQDSLVNKANVQQIERLKANYEIDKKENEIDLLNKVNTNQRNFNLTLGGGILIFGVLAVMLYQSNQQKNDANQMLSKQQLIVTRREEEKALLLKELNHRVKNNLQMVSSLLSLQGSQLEGHPAADAINAGKSRVEALSLIHQRLYQEDVHTTIDIKEYLEQLISNLFYSHGEPFEPNLEIEAFQLDIDMAIPVSLIVNELVTNSLKYAYDGVENPQMTVSLSQLPGQYQLEVSDNGIGLDDKKDISNSFGLKLVRSLVHQLDGMLEILKIPAGGVAIKIVIPISPGNT